MKRIGNLYQKICSIDNLLLADYKASRGKSKQAGVINHRLNASQNILLLHERLISKTYNTSKYKTFIIREPKERIIHQLPYRDRIVHHAVVNIIGEVLLNNLTSDTYSCIPDRGIHLASYKLRNIIRGGGFRVLFKVRY